MKYTFQFFVFAILIAATLLTSCVSSKKTQASRKSTSQIEKQNVETRNSDEEKNIVKKSTVKKVTKTSEENIENKDVFITSPPVMIKNNFKTSYPKATEVLWTKLKASSEYKNKLSSDYKVNFFLDGKKQSVRYIETGEWIEIREEILPDQLPQNVHNAIKKSYPGLFVISANKIKHKKTDASYTAVIRNELISSEQEVTLTEQGDFIK